MKKRMFAAFIAVLMALAVMPLSLTEGAAPAEPARTVPEGYNAHDYNAIVAFLETQSTVDGKTNGEALFEDYDPSDPSSFSEIVSSGDEGGYDAHDLAAIVAFLELDSAVQGKKNGQLISEDYDPADPSTFSVTDNGGKASAQPIVFAEDANGRLHLKSVHFEGNTLANGLAGDIDLSGCAGLTDFYWNSQLNHSVDLSDCASLTDVYFDSFGSYTVAAYRCDVSRCTALTDLYYMAANVNSAVVGIMSCTSLESYTRWTDGESVDVSGHPTLKELNVYSETGSVSVNANSCTALQTAYLDGPGIIQAQFDSCTALTEVSAIACRLVWGISLSGCTALQNLYLSDCRLENLYVGSVPYLGFSYAGTRGSGFIDIDGDMLYAVPDDTWGDISFSGWYDEYDNLVSTSNPIRTSSYGCDEYYANFSDYNGGGFWKGEEEPTRSAPAPADAGDSNICSFRWEKIDGEYRLVSVEIRDKTQIAGGLDLSGCTALRTVALWDLPCVGSTDVSGCTALETLYACRMLGGEFDLSGCSSLVYAYIGYTTVDPLLLSGCTALEMLECSDNEMTELDLSCCPQLKQLVCLGDRFRRLELGCCPELGVGTVSVEGEGYIGVSSIRLASGMKDVFVSAEPEGGAEFFGWYNADGEQIETSAWLDMLPMLGADVTARFSGGSDQPIAGDLDGDGHLSFNDVSSLYLALLNGSDSIANGDVDGNGDVNFADITALYLAIMG